MKPIRFSSASRGSALFSTFSPASTFSQAFSIAGTLCLISTAQAGTANADHPLEEVIVNSLAFKASVDDAIQPVSVLSGTELENQLSSSLGETLAKQPGITATYFGPNASRPIIRGLSGERVMMLEDSLSSLDVSSLSEDHAVSIEDSLAKQIEIVKGPAALLYGSGAVGGVINVLSNRLPDSVPAKPVTGMAQLRYDTATDERSGVAALDMGQGNYAFHVDGYKKQSSDVRIPGDAFSAQAKADLLASDPNAFIPNGRIYNSASDSKGGAAGGSWLGDQGSVGLSVSSFATYYGVPMAPGETPADGSHIDMKQTRYDFKAHLDGVSSGQNDWFKGLTLRVAHNDYHHAEIESDGTVGTAFNQQGTEARLVADHQLGGLQGSLGVQWRKLDFVAQGDEPFVPASVTRNTSVFGFEQYQLAPFTLEAGARIEAQKIDANAASGLPDYSKTATSGSLGAMYKFAGTQSLAVNLTHSQRHPSATELYADGVHDATGQFIVGDVNLKPESANTVDLIWRGGSQVHWHVSTYLNQFKDYIYLQPTGNQQQGLPEYVYRQNNARYVGAEATLRWHVFAQGSEHLDVELAADAVRATLSGGESVPQIPPMRTGITVEYGHSDWHTEMSVFRYASQDRVADNELPTDGYTLIDASVQRSWMLDNGMSLQGFLKGSNLGDVIARRHTSPLKEYVPLPGRSLTVGMTVKF